MIYLKAIDLWAPGVQRAVTSGQLKLQVGQWVYCGNYEHPSRYVSHSGGTFNVVHWQGSGKATQAAFRERVRCAKIQGRIGQ